jgi:hypothetical protein
MPVMTGEVKAAGEAINSQGWPVVFHEGSTLDTFSNREVGAVTTFNSTVHVMMNYVHGVSSATERWVVMLHVT